MGDVYSPKYYVYFPLVCIGSTVCYFYRRIVYLILLCNGGKLRLLFVAIQRKLYLQY